MTPLVAGQTLHTGFCLQATHIGSPTLVTYINTFLQYLRQPQGPIGTDSGAAAESADRLTITDDAAAERA